MPDIPSIIRGVQDDYRNLYYSEPMAALKVPVTLQSGYGLLKIGTALSKNLSALTTGGKDQLLPYNPTTFTGAEKHPGRAYLVADSGTVNKLLYVSQEDSWKFKVGDDVCINSTGVAAENLGAVTAIDRTTDLSRALITVTTNIGGSSFTVAEKACIFVEAGISANNYSDGVGILEKSVDTGVGENAKGAVATLILGNCVLYEGLLTNVDAAFRTDVSAAQFGQYMYIR